MAWFHTLLGVAALQLTASVLTAYSDPARVLSVLRDYEADALGPRPAFRFWKWTEEQKRNAGRFTKMEVIAGQTPFGRQCWKLTVSPDLPPSPTYPIHSLGADYLPPEADTVRLRARVLSGHFIITVGSPTVYFGNSDVWCRPQTLEPGDWQSLEFSLNNDLLRNFRRAIFSDRSPVIYYTRWIQEPMYLYLQAGSVGELLVDQVELLGKGEGRPFPCFTDDEVSVVGVAQDFETAESIQSAFTFAQDDQEYAQSHQPQGQPRRPPARLRWVTTGLRGKGSLEACMVGREEMSFVGVRALAPAGASAVRITLQAHHASDMDPLALDFLALVAPPDERSEFPWDRLRATAQRQLASPGAFDYNLSRRSAQGLSYGFYHARRAVPNGAWTTLVIPFADFICAFGQGESEPLHLRQLLLPADHIFAPALVSPYRQRAAEMRIVVDDIEWVAVPGSPRMLQSYWQVPDLTRLETTLDASGPHGGVFQQHLP